ncbi:MDR family MFS transporter [Effusibacillus consociatus]|uniref:MDR family MFS transporter n=1 Tax=Effusibacillus consociatus TaxID=1117041 RepID=A0ABV9Q0X6_9BACL
MRLSLPDWSAGLWCLQLSAFLTNFGFFMLIPLLAVHFTDRLGLSLAMAGTLYAVRLFSQQGLMLFGGVMADRIGYRESMLIGSVIRSAGFAMFGFIQTLPLLFLACVLAGAGGALFSPAWQAATTELSTPDNREQIFSWRNVFGNAGLTLGPVAGAWMSGMNIFEWICYVSASIYIVFGILVWILLPKIQVVKRDHPSLINDIKHIAENRRFVWLTVWLMGFYILYQQMYMVIPVLAKEQAGQDISGYLFTGMSILIIFFQQPITRLIERFHLQQFPVMTIGMFLLGISFLPAAFDLSLITVTLPVMGIAFASMLIQPTSQAWIAEIAEKELVASYFGFASLSVAIGGTIGSSGGGWIVDQAFAAGYTRLPFLLFALIPIGCGIGIWLLCRRKLASDLKMEKRGSALRVE